MRIILTSGIQVDVNASLAEAGSHDDTLIPGLSNDTDSLPLF